MNDFTKKVGKGALGGLINKEEPKPTKVWNAGDSYYDDVPSMHRSHWSDPPGYSPPSSPSWQGGQQYELGQSVGAGRGTGNALYTEEGKFAVLGDNECRRMLNLIAEDFRQSLRRYGIHWNLSNESNMHDRIHDLLFSGGARIRNSRGTPLTLCNEDQMLELAGRRKAGITDAPVAVSVEEEVDDSFSTAEIESYLTLNWTHQRSLGLNKVLREAGLKLEDISGEICANDQGKINMREMRAAIKRVKDSE